MGTNESILLQLSIERKGLNTGSAQTIPAP